MYCLLWLLVNISYMLMELFLAFCSGIYSKFRISEFLLLKDYKVVL